MAISLSTISPITRTYLFPATNSTQYSTTGTYNLTLSPSANAKITLLTSPSHARRPVSAAVSSSTGASQSSIETGSLVERVEVFDLNGNSILISDLWKDRKAVVAFARHFGCVLCRKRADMLAAQKDKMDASGVALVLIGPEVLIRLERSSRNRISKEAALKIIGLYMEGYRQNWELSFEKDTRSPVQKVAGMYVIDVFKQQGGIMVAGPGISNISYIHRDKEAGDDPEVEEVLRACCS